MKSQNLKGKTALVTGASGGLGADFARELASRGADLVLVARRKEELHQIADELCQNFGVSALVLPADLSIPGAPEEVFQAVRRRNLTVDILVNNAGFGIYGPFTEIPWEQEQAMLNLDILALVHLTKLFVNAMIPRRFGHVLLVSSIGAYQPTPTYASYAAAKAFVLNFGVALSCELNGTGVNVTVISPGVTATDFFKISGQKINLFHRLMVMQSKDVARIGIQAMLKGRTSVIPGWVNALNAFAARLFPRRLVAAVVYRLMTIRGE